eukprot:2615628-Rhodomonas_salina.2
MAPWADNVALPGIVTRAADRSEELLHVTCVVLDHTGTTVRPVSVPDIPYRARRCSRAQYRTCRSRGIAGYQALCTSKVAAWKMSYREGTLYGVFRMGGMRFVRGFSTGSWRRREIRAGTVRR